MKKLFLLLIIIFFNLAANSHAAKKISVDAITSILIDYYTNDVLFEDNADHKIYPASMTKIMTAIVAFDLLKKGDVTLDEEVIAFHRAGIGLCVWADMVTRIEERADKRFSNYLYMSMTMGAVRLEGKRVVKILCDNS